VPWHIEKRDDKFCVIKDADGDNEGCHDSEAKAKAQMRALYASEGIEGRASVDNSEWDGNAAMSSAKTASDYRAICAGERSAGEPDERAHWALPHHKSPGAPPNAAGVRNALARLAQTQGLKNAGAARSHLEAHMATIRNASENRAPAAPIESRAATVGEVSFPQRTIEVLAVPYEQEALVEYRGELWMESFERGAFNGIQNRPADRKVKAYRDHAAGAHTRGTNTAGLIGEVTTFDPDRPDGLVGSVRIAPTPLGEETLTLANMGILGVSIGFGVRGSDQVLNRSQEPPRRRIRRAFVDHLAFPDNGAYEGAQVIDVRRERQEAADLPKLETPRLDEVIAWLESRR
jgi:phage head maturation protease